MNGGQFSEADSVNRYEIPGRDDADGGGQYSEEDSVDRNVIPGSDDSGTDDTWRRTALEHGCLLLGDDDAWKGNTVELQPPARHVYVTKYRIDHDVSTRSLCSKVALEKCIPCCSCSAGHEEEDEEGEEEERPVSWFWYFVGSELALFTLHMSAVVFGVTKEALDMRQHDSSKALHFAHTVIETVATFLVIVLMMLNTRMGHVEVLEAVRRLEHFDLRRDAHLRTIQTWMFVAIAGGFVLIGACVGCFIAFYAYAHLGWTVLSNQACIIISLAVFGLYESRVVSAVYKIKTDQQNVVIHEAVMLLRDLCKDDNSELRSSSSSRVAAMKFIRAVRHTTPLKRPKYINMTCATASTKQQSC